MAKCNLKYFRYCTLTGEEEVPGPGKNAARAIKADIKIDATEAQQWSDGGLGENVREFNKGTITQEVNDFELEILGELLGNTVTEGELVSGTEDIPPFVRVGFVAKRMINGVPKHRALVYSRVQYGIPDESYETKGNTTVLKSDTIVGTVMRGKDGSWKRSEDFDTEAEAVAYIDKLCNYKQTPVEA